MKLLFCHDTYYTQTKDGNVLAYGAFPYSLWADRFLPHFREITVIGREKNATEGDEKRLDVSSGEHVKFRLLPNINTPFKRLFKAGANKRAIAEEVAKADALVIRGPVEAGMMAAAAARKLGKPYAVEVSGCAFDHTWYHGSLIGKLYAPVKYFRAREMVKHADAAIYVTRDFLQRRYPCDGLIEYASNVEIEPVDPQVLQKRLERFQNKPDHLIIGLIGNINNALKGFEIALKSLSEVKEQLPRFTLRVLGQAAPEKWEETIKSYGLEGCVEFSGTLPGGEAVMKWLDDIDLYIQPSFHEGLPRAVIEAMSRGCPVLASNAGGTEELLPKGNIHKKGDWQALATALTKAALPNWMTENAKLNFEVARRYTRDELMPRRFAFWKKFAGLAKSKRNGSAHAENIKEAA